MNQENNHLNNQQTHIDFNALKHTETVRDLEVMQFLLPTVHLPNYHNESFAQSKESKNKKVQCSAEKYLLWSPLTPYKTLQSNYEISLLQFPHNQTQTGEMYM